MSTGNNKQKLASEQSSQYNSQGGAEEKGGAEDMQKEGVREEIPSVMEAKKKLDHLIEELNGKLVQHFKMKEEALLNQYKKELVEQQKKLNELKNTTNEEQIRSKMLERKAELEKERNHLIEKNMFYSQKCEQYKQTYTKLVQESKDLEKEIQFLDGQIAAANEKRMSLVDEVASISNTDRNPDHLDLYTQKKAVLPELEKGEKSTLEKSHNTQSVRKIARSLHLGGEERPKKSSSTRQFQKIERGLLRKSALERVFEECVEEVKGRRKSKRTMPILKGEEFTEYEKRAIMEIFLGNEEVKKKLY